MSPYSVGDQAINSIPFISRRVKAHTIVLAGNLSPERGMGQQEEGDTATVQAKGFQSGQTPTASIVALKKPSKQASKAGKQQQNAPVVQYH